MAAPLAGCATWSRPRPLALRSLFEQQQLQWRAVELHGVAFSRGASRRRLRRAGGRDDGAPVLTRIVDHGDGYNQLGGY